MQHINKFKNDFHKRFCSWNCPIWFKNMQSFLQIIVHAKAFEIFIVLCIIINTIFLAADHHDADDNLKNALSIGNSGATVNHLIHCGIRIWSDFNDDLFSFYIYLCCRSISQDIGSWIYNLPAGSLEYIRFCDCHNIDFGRLYFADVNIRRSPKLWIKRLENSQVHGQKWTLNRPWTSTDVHDDGMCIKGVLKKETLYILKGSH